MESLYNISQNLLRIFDELEDNGGELTMELAKELEITQENYAAKLENYAKVVQQYKKDIEVIKAEKERLDKRKKTFENRIKRLEDAMLNAVNNFGGVETGLFKIGTRKTKSTEIAAERIDYLNKALFHFAGEIHENGVIAFGEDCDVQGMLDVINANAEAEHEYCYGKDNTANPFIPYTVDDLTAINVNISSKSSIMDLFTKKSGMLEAVLNNNMYFDVAQDNSKTEIKKLIESGLDITIADIKSENKLSIR